MAGFFTRGHDDDRSTEATTAAPKRLHLLLVDEKPLSRTAIARRLTRLHYDVAVAETGFAAIGSLATRPADIVLIDLGLTHLPAIATLRRLRAIPGAASAAFVLIAGRQDAASVSQALAAGADDHLVKPFDFDILDARLRHLCQRTQRIGALARHNAELDARIARRALELGETRDVLRELQRDRARLVSSIEALHARIERMQSGEA